MKDYVNPANGITAARFIALPLFWYWLAHDMNQLAAIAVIYTGVLDLFDGAVARAFHCTSTFGEMFDAIADGICYAYFIILLVAYGRVPAVPAIGILVVGAINVTFRAIYARRAGRATNYRSFAMERTVAFLAYLSAFGVARFEATYYFWSCFAVMVIVVVHDTKRMLVDPVPEP